MRKAKAQNSGNKTSRVKVSRLQQQEKELKNDEAERVKGGGGARAGVDMPLKTNSAV
jgi:hypothetical protein